MEKFTAFINFELKMFCGESAAGMSLQVRLEMSVTKFVA
jgi:hypothetical protein